MSADDKACRVCATEPAVFAITAVGYLAPQALVCPAHIGEWVIRDMLHPGSTNEWIVRPVAAGYFHQRRQGLADMTDPPYAGPLGNQSLGKG